MHIALGEGLCLVHLKDQSLRISSSLLLPAHCDTDKAGKPKFVKHVTITYTDIAETSPVLSDYSGKGSGLVTTAGRDGCCFIHLRSVSLTCSSTNSSFTLELLLTVPVEQR